MLIADSSTLLMYALPVLGSTLLAYGIFQVIVESRTTRQKRLQDRLRGESSRTEKPTSSILRRGAMGQEASFADALLGKFKFMPKLQVMLDQADIPWRAPQMMLNLCCAAGAIACVLVLLHIHLVVALGVAAAVVMMPLFVINFIRRARMDKLVNQLPDVFDMMSQALRAGHSLAGAMQLIHEQMPAPIATEFGQVYHEQNLGVKIEDALQSMAGRVDSLDLKFFVTAVMVQRQTGGDLAEVLDNIGTVIRQRIELRGMVQGLTAEGRLSGWVLFALPIVVFVGSLYLNPEYGGLLLDDPRGKIMLIVAGGMQLMGLAMIRWIVNIKV